MFLFTPSKVTPYPLHCLFYSTDFLSVYEKKYYLQVYLDNSVNKITNKLQIILMTILQKIRYYKYCIISHYWLLNHGLAFQDSACSGCHDLTMLSVNNTSNIAIITIKNADYRCIIHNISKSEPINLLENSVLEHCGYI